MMKADIRKAYHIWLIIAIIYSFFSLPIVPRIYYIISSSFTVKKMVVSSFLQASSTSKRRSYTIYGSIGDKTVEAYLADDEIEIFSEYLNKYDTEINGDNLTPLNLEVPVVQFSDSDSVLLIPKGKTGKEAISIWLNPFLLLWSIAYFPLVILYILRKVILQ